MGNACWQVFLPDGPGRTAQEPPQDAGKNPEGYECKLPFGSPEDCFEDFEGENRGKREDECPENHPREPFENPPPDGHSGMRRREFPAAALAAHFRDARIRMVARAKFHVVTPSAKIAVERIARSHPSAFVAVLHKSSLMSGSRSSPFGRNQIGPKKSFSRTAR